MRPGLPHSALGECDSGAIDQTVERAKFTHDRLDTPFGGCPVGDIGLDESRSIAQFLSECRADFLLDIGDHNAPATGKKSPHARGSQSRSAARDQKGPILDLHGRRAPPGQIRSMIVAVAIPCPMHMTCNPVDFPVASSPVTILAIKAAPVAPRG